MPKDCDAPFKWLLFRKLENQEVYMNETYFMTSYNQQKMYFQQFTKIKQSSTASLLS